MPRGYAILIRSDTSDDLLKILDGFVREKDSLKYILSKSIDVGGHFTALEVIKDKNDIPWKISIPTHIVIAIAEIESESARFGFMP